MFLHLWHWLQECHHGQVFFTRVLGINFRFIYVCMLAEGTVSCIPQIPVPKPKLWFGFSFKLFCLFFEYVYVSVDSLEAIERQQVP